jgi:hypothetical protein
LYVKAGLATTAHPPVPVEFSLRWGFKEMNAFLRDLFPKLFVYLGESCPEVLTVPPESDTAGIPLDSIEWPYELVTCFRGKFSSIEAIDYPTAADYYRKSATQSSRAWREKVIHLGM